MQILSVFNNNIIQHLMTTGNAGDIHRGIKWFYLCNLDNCYALSVNL